MLQIDNLQKSFGVNQALRGLSINVAAGHIYALLGPNGAGKTTTINACLGFIEPDQGKILIRDIDPVTNPMDARAQLAYIPENVTLYGALSGLENLDYFSELAGKRYDRQALKAFLARAGLPEEAMGREVKTYSKGMRQKVGVAIALAKQARLLLLDEPTSGLDPRASHEFSTLLSELSKDGMAILMATHDLFRARETASHIGIMVDGALKADMRAEDTSSEEIERIYLDATKVAA